MKLSMWMIANRLDSLDMELDISENAPVILNSARQVYAPNCIHVYEDNGYAVCNGEGDIIRIQNMSSLQAFEIMQSVFDYFEDWMEQVYHHIAEKNFQGIIDDCWCIFHNPLILLDGNNKVLGISSAYGADELDSEWKYLKEYGYASIHAVQQLKREHANINFMERGAQAFDSCARRSVALSGVSYCLNFNDIACGRLILLTHERPVNTGDFQLLAHLAKILEPELSSYIYRNESNTGNVFFNILHNKPFDESLLDLQLKYYRWKAGDLYNIALIELSGTKNSLELRLETDMLYRILSYQFSDYVVFKASPYVLVLANQDLSQNRLFREFLERLSQRNPIRIGFALPCHGLKRAGHLYSQAISALFYGKLRKSKGIFFSFFDYAVDYLLDSHSTEENLAACHPAVVAMWKDKNASGNELFYTLKSYLDCACSVSKTSAAIYTHRNTILYRIRKIEGFLKASLNEPYVRDYCLFSIYFLEHYQRKMKLLDEK